MHACSFHLDPHMKSVETKMFWCIKNQLKIGDICWRCNCTCQIELIRLSNRLHYNFKFIKYSWLIKKVVRLQVWNKKKNSAPTTLSCVCGLSLSLFFFLKYTNIALSFRNLAFPLHGSFAISTVSFPVLIFSILPKIYIEIAVLVGFQTK